MDKTAERIEADRLTAVFGDLAIKVVDEIITAADFGYGASVEVAFYERVKERLSSPVIGGD